MIRILALALPLGSAIRLEHGLQQEAQLHATPSKTGKRVDWRFLTPQQEAMLEGEAIYRLHSEKRLAVAADLGVEDFHAVISMGSSSTQIYDSTGEAEMFFCGVRVPNEEEIARLASYVKANYDGGNVCLQNAIGYLVPEGTGLHANLMSEIPDSSPTRDPTGYMGKLKRAFSNAGVTSNIQVLNRADKQYKPWQLPNEWIYPLFENNVQYETIVDWGGGSIKMWQRNGGNPQKTKLAVEDRCLNPGLVLDGKLNCEALRSAVQEVAEMVATSDMPGPVLMLQTGEAREKAYKHETTEEGGECAGLNFRGEHNLPV